MKILIETERLILREIALEDVEGMFDLDSDPEVHKYLGNNPVKDRQEIKKVIHFIQQQYVENGIGRWAIVDKHTNDFVGWTGLKFVREETNNHVDYYDLGYRLRRKYWGQGIAFETAMASLSFAFNNLKIEEVFAIVDVDNIASNKILKKAGLTCIETLELDGVKHNWYTIAKKQFVNLKEPLITFSR